MTKNIDFTQTTSEKNTFEIKGSRENRNMSDKNISDIRNSIYGIMSKQI